MRKLLLLFFAPLLIGGQAAPVTLEGEAPVASNGDFNLALQSMSGTGAIPPSAAPDNVGAFRFICTAGQVLPDDPIVYPGQPGKSHLHQFYGNTGADAYSTYDSLRKTGQSTCNSGVDVPANRSAYWMPAMLDAAGNVVKPDYVTVYYKRRPSSDPKCQGLRTAFGAEGKCIPLPNALRFIFGYDMLTGKAPTGYLWFNCDGPTAAPGHYSNLPQVLAHCPVNQGNRVGAVIEAPRCWDGKNLDSPNHRDHVGYWAYDGNTGQPSCPATHPYVIPEFLLGAWYPSTAGMHLSCDSMVPNKPAGTCFHADYFEGWDPTVKAMWTDNCINKMLNCSAGDLGNGRQLKGAAI
jgi:hypothetical protein